MTNLLLPPNMRRYWTFRSATIVAILATILSACARVFIRFTPEQVARMESQNYLRSPLALGLYYVFVFVAMGFIYATRNRGNWYHLRVTVFAMVLTGALIGLLNVALPLRAS
jgi:hypothetical protein